jgi:hypothetical protein
VGLEVSSLEVFETFCSQVVLGFSRVWTACCENLAIRICSNLERRTVVAVCWATGESEEDVTSIPSLVYPNSRCREKAARPSIGARSCFSRKMRR